MVSEKEEAVMTLTLLIMVYSQKYRNTDWRWDKWLRSVTLRAQGERESETLC